jgi:hypothetical protein
MGRSSGSADALPLRSRRMTAAWSLAKLIR